MWIELILFGITYLLVKLIFSLNWRRNHFSSFVRRGIPGPKPNFWFGNWIEFRSAANKNDLLDQWLKEYGPVFGYYFGQHRFIVVKDLQIIQEACLKNSGILRNRSPFALNSRYFKDSLIALRDERWRLVRKIISPTFAAAKVQDKAIGGVMRECMETLQQQLTSAESKSGFDVDVSFQMQALTLDIIARTSLGLNENVYEKNNQLLHSVREFFRLSNNIAVDLAMFFPFLKTVLTFINNNLTSGKMIDMIVLRLRSHIRRLLKTAGTATESDTSFVGQDPHSPESQMAKEVKSANVLRSLLKRLAEKQITEDEFIGNVLLIILAGYETSANAIAYTIYQLAKHQEVQNKLREELRKEGQESSYLEQVWMESLRYYPPVCLFVNREFSEDLVLNGIQFLKGDILQVPVWAIHHDPEIWPNPFKFDPDRFAEEHREQMHPCQFLAFGLGPRVCLGAHFANFEGKMLLNHLISKYKVEMSEATDDPLNLLLNTVIINPDKNIRLKFTPLK